MWYWAGATGAQVRARADYQREADCTWYLWSSQDALSVNLSSGQDLYWDQNYYDSGRYWNADAGCQPFSWGDTDHVYFGYDWWIYIGYLYSDETINDTSFGCDWWGEEYVGSMYLT